MSETAAKELINQERLTLYDLIASQKILTVTGAEALATIEAALGSGGSTDVTTLAKEATLAGLNEKLPALSGGAVPVTQPATVLSKDHRIITANEVIPAGSYFIYLKVLVGDVTIDGVTYSSNEYLNLESCYPLKHAAISLVIPSGKSIRLVREF